MAEYGHFESEPEVTHVLTSVGGGEYTACGIAFDAGGMGNEWVSGGKAVSCELCRNAVLEMRAVRLSRSVRTMSRAVDCD